MIFLQTSVKVLRSKVNVLIFLRAVSKRVRVLRVLRYVRYALRNPS